MIHSRKDKGGRICIISATLDKLGWKLTESVNEFRFELDNPECDFVMDENRAKCNKKICLAILTHKNLLLLHRAIIFFFNVSDYTVFFSARFSFFMPCCDCAIAIGRRCLTCTVFYFYNNCWSLPRNWGTLNYFQECTDYFCSVQVKIYQTYFLLFLCYFSLLTINHYL